MKLAGFAMAWYGGFGKDLVITFGYDDEAFIQTVRYSRVPGWSEAWVSNNQAQPPDRSAPMTTAQRSHARH